MTETKEISLENLPKPWTRKQFMFAMGIIGGLNQTEAAVKAGYSEKTADSQASRMLGDVKFSHIKDFINSKQESIVKKHEEAFEDLVKHQRRIANANIFDFLNQETGSFETDLRKLPYELGYLISSAKTKALAIKTVEGGEEISLPVMEVEFKLWDKTKAQDMLNKIEGNYEKDNTRRLIHEGGDKPVEFKTMSMEEAAKAYQQSLKDN